jgi:DNA-binding transcriptional ArsR family regulator
MDALEALGDPVRRRIVELLAAGECTAGKLSDAVTAQFGITQPGASRHLRVLREVGLVTSRTAGKQRMYTLDSAAFDEVAEWVDGIRSFWNQHLDALETELVRGRAADRTVARHDQPIQRDQPVQHDQGAAAS